MGILKLPEHSLHWSTKTHFQSNLIKETMSINCFKAIGRHLAIAPSIKGDKLSGSVLQAFEILQTDLHDWQ